MKRLDFEKLLKKWSREILRHDEFVATLSDDAIKSRWVGERPATPDEIGTLETRLKRVLPPSLRAFLEVSNGWRFFDETLDQPRSLLSTATIDLLSRKEPDLTDIWANSGGELEEKPDYMPRSHFHKVVQITAESDGLYFLNPLQQLDGNEWHCYFFSNWVPGEESRGSFADLVENRFHTFLSSYGIAKSDKKRGVKPRPSRNLGKPPAVTIEDHNEFFELIERLGFFDRTPPADVSAMRGEFIKLSDRVKADPTVQYREWVAPGRALLKKSTGRVIDLSIPDVARRGLSYIFAQLRPILAARGVELPVVSEVRGNLEWTAALEGVEVLIARMRNGKPRGLGLEQDVNVAQLLINQCCFLTNRWLQHKNLPPRICEVSELQAHGPEGMSFRLMILDDELAYQFMWSGLLGCYCRVIRPDVL